MRPTELADGFSIRYETDWKGLPSDGLEPAKLEADAAGELAAWPIEGGGATVESACPTIRPDQ